MRGFIGGLAIGLVTVVIGVIVLSVLVPAPPRPNDQPSEQVATGETSQPTSVPDIAPDTAAEAVTEVVPAILPEVILGGGLAADGAPEQVATPNIGDVTPRPNDPSVGDAEPVVKVATSDAPPQSASPTSSLSPPEAEAQPTALNAPAQPLVPDLSEASVGFGRNLSDQETAPAISGHADQAPVSGQAIVVAQASDVGVAPDVTTRPAVPAQLITQEIASLEATDVAKDKVPNVSKPRDADPSNGAPTLKPNVPGADQSPVKPIQSVAATPVQDQSPASAPVPQVGQNSPSGLTAPNSPEIAASPSALPKFTTVAGTTPNVDQSQRIAARASETIPTQVGAQKLTGPKPTGGQVKTLPQSADTGPRIGKRVVPLTERNTTRKLGLQSVQSSVQNAAETGTVATSPSQAGPDQADIPIKANGEIFENPDNLPLMSIVLIDDNKGLGREALSEFPYPITFALDPNDPDALDKMLQYRAAGFEVVLLADLDQQASAQDAEVTLSVWLKQYPNVVGLMEGTTTGIQGNRKLTDQVTTILGQGGFGLIMHPRGLNTSFKLAARGGLPAALVFRDFDGAGQTPVVMRRFLDQAAFRAGQNGGALMLGRLRPNTISTLLIWGLQDRAARVKLAPVSALLLQGVQ